jgi:hypothetical protein
MKSIKTSELTGAALDWAVAKCEGRGYVMDETEYAPDGRTYQRGTAQSGGPNYSSDWAQGGPIIEREGISIVQQGDAAEWVASVYNHSEDDWHLHTTGPIPLIAAMRCYVASKMGDTIEVPEELI